MPSPTAIEEKVREVKIDEARLKEEIMNSIGCDEVNIHEKDDSFVVRAEYYK